MVYADYNFYLNDYMGNVINDEAFDRVALRASHYIDTITSGKAKDNDELEEIKMATCAIAEQYFLIETYNQKAVADGDIESQTVGNYSVKYRNSMDREKEAESKILQLAREYLLTTGLLYRGCRRCTDLTL